MKHSKHPLSEQLSKQYAKVVAQLSDQQLQALLAELDDLNETNCNWVAYELRGATREIAQTLLEARAKGKLK